MKKDAKDVLLEIPIEQIDRNPENPRLFFRQKEMDELTDSIRRFGVRVPIAVYREKHKYILIDGERRWRCSLKLNKKTIPAIVQDKPDALQNLILMFNIHALREQWDLLTVSLKLPRVIQLFTKERGFEPNEAQLSEETGLSRSMIRRCKLLMSLPPHHIEIIKAELGKPKSEQRVSEDVYIELEKSLTTVARAMPEVISNEEQKEKARQIMLEKYKSGVVGNLVEFRKIAKMARASNVEADTAKAKKELEKLFTDKNYSIEYAFQRSVSIAYSERDLKLHLEKLIDELDSINRSAVDDEITELLERLVDLAHKLIKG